MKPIPEHLKSAAQQHGDFRYAHGGRPWWRLVSSAAGWLRSDGTRIEPETGGLYVCKLDPMRGIRIDAPRLDIAMETVDLRQPLPIPDFESGQRWLDSTGGTWTVKRVDPAHVHFSSTSPQQAVQTHVAKHMFWHCKSTVGDCWLLPGNAHRGWTGAGVDWHARWKESMNRRRRIRR